MKIKFIFIISFCLNSFLLGQYNGGSGSGYGTGSSNVVGVSAFMQGPFSSGSMTTALKTNNFIPLTQPYNTSPWNYTGTESVASIPSGVVDWVLIELRATTASSSTIQKRACFIKSDGSFVDTNGTSPVTFDKTDGNTYYVVIRHRNHLAVMSANALTLSSSLAGVYLTGGSSNYNFSSAQTQAYGTNAMKDLLGDATKFGMWMGDVNSDGVVKYNLANNDRLLIYNRIGNAGFNVTVSGYYNEDINLDGIVKYNLSNNDRLLIYNVIGNGGFNVTRSNQVPN
ncbi:MAG: hypothetical protein Q8M94_05465 [Ignavibacteria bacterium]|nr:hypothetical protein [Ignavibacteria bacterium]